MGLMQFIKTNFQFLIIILLFGIILLQRCNTSPTPESKPTIVTTIDTSWKHLQQPIVNVYPTVTNHIPYAVGTPGVTTPGIHDTLYIPSANDSILRIQYEALRDSLLSSNTYSQRLKYDSSYVDINDTVSQNRITGRSYRFTLKYPVITTSTTITIPPKSVTQLYFGGGLSGSPTALIQGANLGLILKTKTDHLYGVKVGITAPGVITYGVDTYWKIKF